MFVVLDLFIIVMKFIYTQENSNKEKRTKYTREKWQIKISQTVLYNTYNTSPRLSWCLIFELLDLWV